MHFSKLVQDCKCDLRGTQEDAWCKLNEIPCIINDGTVNNHQVASFCAAQGVTFIECNTYASK